MGTELQIVYDNFFRHVPEVDFTYQQDQVYGFLQDSLGYIDDTVPEALTYTIEENNAVLIVGSQAEKDGDIKIIVQNSTTNEYTVSVLTTDTKAEIATKITSELSADFDVTQQSCSGYSHPIITVSSTEDIVVTYLDTDTTCVQMDIQRAYDGYFTDDLSQSTINLIGWYMFRGYHDGIIVGLELYKQHIGTDDINKLPDSIKYQLSNSIKALEAFDCHLEKLEQKFNDYTY